MPQKKSPQKKLLSVTETVKYCRQHLPRKSFSQATLYRQIAKKTFPAPTKLGSLNFWRKKEIDSWITKLVDGK